MENNWREQTTGGCADATGYPQEGTAPEPINYRAKLKEAADRVRTFGTGATRNSDAGKLDYEGFISPLVVQRFSQYMHRHRQMEDGTLRDSDNWQKGIPRQQYLKSMLRHVMDVWLIMRNKAGYAVERSLEEALCAVKFNVDGLLHEVLVLRDAGSPSYAEGLLHEVLVLRDAGSPSYAEGWRRTERVG